MLDNGPTLGEGHQRWQLNEVNELIWRRCKIGVMDPESFRITNDIAVSGKVIKARQAKTRTALTSPRTPSTS